MGVLFWALHPRRVLERRLRLTRSVSAAVAAGACAAVAAVLVFAAMFEDVTTHDGLATSDPGHLQFFVSHRTDTLVGAARVVTDLGAAPSLALGSVLAAIVLWWRGARVVVAVAPAIALGLAGAAASVVKTLVGRARPPAALRLVAESQPSFPSGHSTDSAAFFVSAGLVAAIVIMRRPASRALTVAVSAAMAGSVGLTRLVLGVHWPTDVVGGWALGTAVALLVVAGALALGRLTPPDDATRLRWVIVARLNSARAARR